MKYIRTKDGRIIDLARYDDKTSPVGKALYLITLIDKKRVCDLEIFKKDIIKQADTIEELCDEFIIDFGKTNYPTTSRYKRYWDFDELKKEIEDRENNFHRYLNIDFIVYGAIWTDKGLIYVAKMNAKGELELL